ncbi:hypothetical protein LCM10_09500 [Rossellomorea aquimaris]|uniref:hypothetical protein n=1 Tax=Rossellomorea aquimaris TaxID=189382 RepID=UPI001CD3AD5A|nr:hypothetical protein [Rossellomorea aquimaris]MCA1055222.1 hypothetical protein [Rossellomorea aquimaris]
MTMCKNKMNRQEACRACKSCGMSTPKDKHHHDERAVLILDKEKREKHPIRKGE